MTDVIKISKLESLIGIWRHMAKESRDTSEKHTVLRETNLAYAAACELCARQLEERIKPEASYGNGSKLCDKCGQIEAACTCNAEVVKTCGNCGGAGWYTIPTGANGEITEQCQCDECFGQPEQAKEIESLPKGWPEIGGAVIEMRLKIEELITAVNELRRRKV